MSIPDLPVPTPGQTGWAVPLNESLELLNDRIQEVNGELAGLESFTSVKAYGAVGDGVTDDSAAIEQAQAESRAVLYPSGDYVPGEPKNVYGSNYTNALGPRLQSGLDGSPVSDPRPVFWVQKHSSATRTTNASEWEQGAIYASLIKESGDAYGAALTGFFRHESAEGGDGIGVHGRASAHRPLSEVWGGWFYAHAASTTTAPQSIIGVEINLNSKAPDQGHSPATRFSKGLLVVTQDNSEPVSMGIEVGRGTGAPNGYIHTGIKVRANSISQSDSNSASSIPNNEAVLVEGATSSGTAAGGIRLRNGWFRYGISLAEASFSNFAAITLGEGHRITVGAGAGVSRYLEFSSTEAYANFNNLGIRVNGEQVIAPRRTGWGSPTGTATRSSFATGTATVTQVAERLKALIDDLTSHGLIGA